MYVNVSKYLTKNYKKIFTKSHSLLSELFSCTVQLYIHPDTSAFTYDFVLIQVTLFKQYILQSSFCSFNQLYDINKIII